MVQLAMGVAVTEGRKTLLRRDMEWVVESGQYSPRPEKRVGDSPQVGVVNGLAVWGPGMGSVIEVEATAVRAQPGRGSFMVTGVVEEEEQGDGGRVLRRRSMARSSVDNVCTVLRVRFQIEASGEAPVSVGLPSGAWATASEAGRNAASSASRRHTRRKSPRLTRATAGRSGVIPRPGRLLLWMTRSFWHMRELLSANSRSCCIVLWWPHPRACRLTAAPSTGSRMARDSCPSGPPRSSGNRTRPARSSW